MLIVDADGLSNDIPSHVIVLLEHIWHDLRRDDYFRLLLENWS